MDDTIVAEAEVAVHRMFDRCTYDSRKETYFICLKNKGTTQDVSFLQTELNRALCDKLEEDRTEGSVLKGTIRKLFDFQHVNYIECIHIDCCRTESFNGSEHGQKSCLDVYASFNKYVEGHEHHAVNHGLQAKQLWDLPNNADIADLKLFLETRLGLDLRSPLPVKNDENILLLFKLYGLGKELCFMGIKVSSEPSEILTKQDEIAGFTLSEGYKFHEAGVKFMFAGICYIPTLGLLRPGFQLCEHICRSHSPSFGSTPLVVCSIGWILSLRRSLAIHQRHLCSLLFRVLPKLLPLSHGLPNKFQEDDHVHPTLMEIVVGNLQDLPQEILIDIFSLLEIPDLVRAGSVCSSWNSACTRIIS